MAFEKDKEEFQRFMDEAGKIIHSISKWNLAFQPGREGWAACSEEILEDWVDSVCEDFGAEKTLDEAIAEGLLPDLRKKYDGYEQRYTIDGKWFIWRGNTRRLEIPNTGIAENPKDREFAEFVYSSILDRQEHINWWDDAAAAARQLDVKLKSAQKELVSITNNMEDVREWASGKEQEMLARRSIVRPDLKEEKP